MELPVGARPRLKQERVNALIAEGRRLSEKELTLVIVKLNSCSLDKYNRTHDDDDLPSYSIKYDSSSTACTVPAEDLEQEYQLILASAPPQMVRLAGAEDATAAACAAGSRSGAAAAPSMPASSPSPLANTSVFSASSSSSKSAAEAKTTGQVRAAAEAIAAAESSAAAEVRLSSQCSSFSKHQKFQACIKVRLCHS